MDKYNIGGYRIIETYISVCCKTFSTCTNCTIHCSKMDSEFSCPICMDICEDAVESNCCHRIFCSICLSKVQTCPNCRKAPPSFTFETAHFVRRVIGNISVDCPEGCGAQVTRSELKAHVKNCPSQQIACPAPNCGFKDEQKMFARHLLEAHEDTLVKRAWFLFNDPQPLSVENVPVCPSIAGSTITVEDLKGRVNGKNVTARLGESGKFYCGSGLGTLCGCCNGRCGPTDGCNCSACMKLDVLRARLPSGWFINRDGYPAHLSPETNQYYCGRRVKALRSARFCDGCCGPNNGPNCFACKKLDEQAIPRYQSIWR